MGLGGGKPGALRQEKLDIALTTYGLADKKVFRKNVKLALDRGLSETDALAALTTVPAKLCGVDKQLGTIEPGKIANLTIVDGKGYFDPRVTRAGGVGGRAQLSCAIGKEEVTKRTRKGANQSDKEKKAAELKELENKRVARSPMEGREHPNYLGGILISGATVWTCGPQGVVTNVAVSINDSKRISYVGRQTFEAELTNPF